MKTIFIETTPTPALVLEQIRSREHALLLGKTLFIRFAGPDGGILAVNKVNPHQVCITATYDTGRNFEGIGSFDTLMPSRYAELKGKGSRVTNPEPEMARLIGLAQKHYSANALTT